MENDEKKGTAIDPGKGQMKLQIKAGEEVSKGVYSNVAFAHYNENEFVFDFVFIEPGRPQGHVVSRVITSPRAAKKLVGAINGLVHRYEEKYGEIEIPDPATQPGSYH